MKIARVKESPAVRQTTGPGARHEELAAELARVRRRTLAVLEPVSDADLVRQHSPLMSPLVWDLAHVAYFEELWLVRRVGGLEPLAEHGDLYDAFAHARAERASLPLLDPEAARRYARDVRARTLEVLDRVDLGADDPLLREGFVYRMLAQHEGQHVETMLATLQLRDDVPYPLPVAAPPPVAAPGTHEVVVPGGRFPQGTDDDPWAYDNERPRHGVELPPVAIDALPVSNADYLAFVESGGYRDRRPWSEAGWAWRVETGAEAPAFWSREGEGGWSRVRFGHREAVPLDEPVEHVCWYEADAFARWAEKRLPTEAEWERAAAWAPGGDHRRLPWGDDGAGERANLGGRRFGPSPVGSFPAGASAAGALQLLGDVWEWTASTFDGYAGFAAFPYREYSEAFFGGEYRVLRGGSWATDATVARTTFRNWDLPARRQIFAGFRCARDV